MVSSNVSCIAGVHCPLATRFCLTSSPVCYQNSIHTFICLCYTGDIGYVLSFYSGTESHWNEGDQPEHQCLSQSDLPIPDACGNTIIIKSLSSLLTLTMIKLQLGV